jgi:hypothetical protein
MPKRFTFMVEGPSIRVVLGHLTRDDDFIADARWLLDLDKQLVQSLTKDLNSAPGFLDDAAVLRHAVLHFGDDGTRIATIVKRVGSVLRNTEDSLEDVKESLESVILEKMDAFDGAEKSRLVELISSLTLEPQGIVIQRKAEILANQTGNDLESVEFVSDMRPILDASRKRIVGLIPLTTMRIEHSGDPSGIDLLLTEPQLMMLCDKANSAKNKIEVIKKFSAEAGIDIPKTPATEISHESDNG